MTGQNVTEQKSKLSVDWWAVILAAAAVILVRVGFISHVPW